MRQALLAHEVVDIYRYWQKHKKIERALRCHTLLAVAAAMERRQEERLVLLRNPLEFWRPLITCVHASLQV